MFFRVLNTNDSEYLIFFYSYVVVVFLRLTKKIVCLKYLKRMIKHLAFNKLNDVFVCRFYVFLFVVCLSFVCLKMILTVCNFVNDSILQRYFVLL